MKESHTQLLKKPSIQLSDLFSILAAMFLVLIAGITYYLLQDKQKSVVSFDKTPIEVSQNSKSVGRYDIYELRIDHDDSLYSNKWEDVNVPVLFTSPKGKTFPIDGFYYDQNQWRVRFSPTEVGTWQWELTFATPTKVFGNTGSFTVDPSSNLGFLKRHPTNPYRIVFEDGSLFNAIGFGDCVLDRDNNKKLDSWGLDGQFPPSETHEVQSLYTVDTSVYMAAYGKSGAGFNLFRWSVDNCSFKLWDTISPVGNTYLIQEGLWGDELVASLKGNGFRIWMAIFGFNPPFITSASNNQQEQEAVNRYIKYVVARYGAYVDIWELMNEAPCGARAEPPCKRERFPRERLDGWIKSATGYLRSVDPFQRMITTSWERPDLEEIDIAAPHWYQKESELESDIITSRKTESFRKWNKPIIFAEQGNSIQNWDERSALRMRLRSWTAFFEESVLVFWNTSGRKNYMKRIAANIYLGPEERSYIRVLQDFTSGVDPNVVRAKVQRAEVRTYGLRSPKMILAYFHHFTDHLNLVNTSFSFNAPFAGKATWIDPATGNTLQTFFINRGQQTLQSPDFRIDIALKIASQ